MQDNGKACATGRAIVPALSAAFAALRRCLPDRRGVSSLVFGLSASVILGVVGLAVQAGTWYSDYVSLQTVADAASTAGAVGIASAEGKTAYLASAKYVLLQNGVVNGQNGVTVTINSPPASGPNKSNSSAVEVILSKTENLGLAGLFLAGQPLATVRSVAAYGSTVGTCALALGQNLSSSNNGTFYMSGGATLTAPGCTVGSNNTGSKAFYLKPSPVVTAYTIVSAGAVASSCGQGPTGCGNVLTLTKAYSQYHVATEDPLAAVQGVPLPSASTFSPGTCSNVTFTTTTSTVNLTTGVYCTVNITNPNVLNAGGGGSFVFTGGLAIGSSGSLNVTGTSTFYINGNFSITGMATVNIAPGTYFINNGSLIITNSGTLTCSACVAGGAGATFVLMGTSPGTVNISGNSPVSFSAPANNNYSSALDGVAIYEPASNTGTNAFGGTGSLSFQGAFYAPGAILNISGGAGTSSATCSIWIANSITMTGSGYASDGDCGQYGYGWASSGPTPNGVTLVE